MGDSRIRKILVGVNETKSSNLALEHVIEVFGRQTGDRPGIVLLHVIRQPLPGGLEFGEPTLAWEGGGAPPITGHPADEEMLLQQRESAQSLSIKPARARLIQAGWEEQSVEAQVCEGGFSRAAVAEILAEIAQKDGRIDVIVVGRTRRGRLHEALLKSTGERLVHYACRMTVWVVGTCDDSEGKDHDEADDRDSAEDQSQN